MVFLKNHLKASHHLEQGIIEKARSRQTEKPSKKEAGEEDIWRKRFCNALVCGDPREIHAVPKARCILM